MDEQEVATKPATSVVGNQNQPTKKQVGGVASTTITPLSPKVKAAQAPGSPKALKMPKPIPI